MKPRQHRGIGESETESVALMIGAAHGMDTSDYTILASNAIRNNEKPCPTMMGLKAKTWCLFSGFVVWWQGKEVVFMLWKHKARESLTFRV